MQFFQTPNAVPLTQFILPNGEPRSVTAHVGPESARLATQIRKAGYTFECEVLTTGEVSLTCCSSETDIAIVICQNAPGVTTKALEQLIADSHGLIFCIECKVAEPKVDCQACSEMRSNLEC